MKNHLHCTISQLCLPLFLAFCGLGSFQIVEAHPYSAKREFFQLKRSGEWFNYLENRTYVEVVGTKFIGLQSAFNERRTCLFGLSQAGFEESGTFQVQTKFVCFNTDRYQLHMKKEWCELGTPGCEIDPGGISVGIGNLDFAEPTGNGEDRPIPMPDPLYNSYPSLLNVSVYKPLPFPRQNEASPDSLFQ
jgi:hypothetical protein